MKLEKKHKIIGAGIIGLFILAMVAVNFYPSDKMGYSPMASPDSWPQASEGGHFGGDVNIDGDLTVTKDVIYNKTERQLGLGTDYGGNLVLDNSIYQHYYSTNDNLSLYLPFGEGQINDTYDTAYDKSPYANDGVLNNFNYNSASGWDDGKYGNAILLDGSNDFISVANNRSLNHTGTTTMEGWVKLVSTSTLQCIWGKAAYTNDGYRLYLEANNKLVSHFINSAGDGLLRSRFNWDDTDWHHIAIVYDRYNHRIYKDGKEFQGYIGNSEWNDLTYMNDAFSDEDGYRAYPWGFEPQTGDVKHYHLKDGIVKMTGDSVDDNTLFAVPDLTYSKPTVVAGKSYTQSFLIKKTGVSGNGVRLMHQWFDTTAPASMPFQSDYGTYQAGTDGDWIEISYTITAPATAIRGDIVLQFHGIGEVEIKRPRYYLTNASDREIQTSAQPFMIGETTDHNWNFNGYVDEMRIYDRALASDEIRNQWIKGMGQFNAIAGNFRVVNNATTTQTWDSSSATQGACTKYKDVDGGGYTYCYYLNGVQTCSSNSCE